jgi:alpha-glucosidase
VLNLNPPLALKETSWIRPGKAMRDVTLSTTNGKAIIDLAGKLNLQYVEFDWGWYGAEDVNTGDATKVNLDPRRTSGLKNHPGLDLPEIIRYARERNVGVILYVDRRQIKKQRDIIFPLYEKWGVKGVKIGFIEVGPQAETAWLTETVRKAAEHHLVLDIHDQYRPTGLSRTYPNLLTQEGIRGNEQMPTAEHNATLPFTRFIAGAADYTVCYYSNRIKTTHAHQLALAALYYSPLQFLFWYDRPEMYQGEPELDFWRDLPTVWGETRVLDGRIGEFITVARRSGRDWFLGSITNSQARELQVPLRFLPGGRKYVAHIHEDDPASTSRTKVAVRRYLADSKTTIRARLAPSGGQAIRLTPARKDDLAAYPGYPR